MNEENLNHAVNTLRKKALRSRIEGVIYIILIILICGGLTFSFIKFSGRIITVQTGERTVIDTLVINQETGSQSKISYAIGNIVLRLGAVMLAIYIIQVLVGFARYRFKVAEIHSANADSLFLSQGDIDKFLSFSNVLSPNIEFGKMPAEPYDKAVSLVKEALSKVNIK